MDMNPVRYATTNVNVHSGYEERARPAPQQVKQRRATRNASAVDRTGQAGTPLRAMTAGFA